MAEVFPDDSTSITDDEAMVLLAVLLPTQIIDIKYMLCFFSSNLLENKSCSLSSHAFRSRSDLYLSSGSAHPAGCRGCRRLPLIATASDG